jgi:hypothetical protein
LIKKIYSDNTINHFEQRKIVIARLTKTIQSTIDEEGYFMGKSSYIISNKIDYKLLVALLNGKLLNFYFKHRFETTHLAGGYLRFDIPYLQELPIPLITSANQSIHDELVLCVEQLLGYNKSLPDIQNPHESEQLRRKIAYTEKRIDKLVYELYGLSEEEIEVVEEGVK